MINPIALIVGVLFGLKLSDALTGENLDKAAMNSAEKHWGRFGHEILMAESTKRRQQERDEKTRLAVVEYMRRRAK